MPFAIYECYCNCKCYGECYQEFSFEQCEDCDCHDPVEKDYDDWMVDSNTLWGGD